MSAAYFLTGAMTNDSDPEEEAEGTADALTTRTGVKMWEAKTTQREAISPPPGAQPPGGETPNVTCTAMRCSSAPSSHPLTV